MINSAPRVKELLSSDNCAAARDQARTILRPSNYPPWRKMWCPQWQGLQYKTRFKGGGAAAKSDAGGEQRQKKKKADYALNALPLSHSEGRETSLK